MIPLRDNVPGQNTPWVTWLLISVNLLIFGYQSTMPQQEIVAFFNQYGFIPLDLSQNISQGFGIHLMPVIPTLLSSLFVHGSWLHVVSNMWSLWLFGDNVEDSVGHFRFLLFYLAGGVTASMAHYLFNSTSSLPTVGASGAIAAVMGAYLLMFPLARIRTLVPLLFIPLFFDIPALVFIGFWFITQVFSGVSSTLTSYPDGGIAWWAHVGGFIFGLLVIPLIRKKRWQYHCFYENGHYHCQSD